MSDLRTGGSRRRAGGHTGRTEHRAAQRKRSEPSRHASKVQEPPKGSDDFELDDDAAPSTGAARAASELESPQAIERLIRAAPKTELHLHLEGTLEPELMFKLAKRNGVKLPFKSPAEVRKAYQFTDLQSFLDIYYAGTKVLLKEQDFYDLTLAYLGRAAKDNVQHVEVFFDPQSHTSRGVPFDTVMKGITRALADGEKKYGVSSQLILSFLRDQSPESAMSTLEQAIPYQRQIAAVGLDSAEKGNPPEKFAEVFARARSLGIKAVAHAGEEGPPSYIWQALDVLKVDRVDHGVRAIEDRELVRRLARDGVPLTMAPLSNLKLKVVDSLQHHTLKKLLDAGVCVTVNSDDPAYFGGYATKNLLAVSKALKLSRAEVVQVLKNGFQGSFISDAEKAKAMRELDRLAQQA
jgi:adenine deaminase